jgi:epoxyqueuosine reductase
MLTRTAIEDAARSLGFADLGVTTAEPFDSHRAYLEAHQETYGWTEAAGLPLKAGCDPQTVLAGARCLVVLMEIYFQEAYPPWMEGHFGRCYLDDDRVTKDGLTRRIKAFRAFLRAHGVASKVPFHLPHRMAAARAGMGTFGHNGLFYASRVARRSSWVLPIPVVVDLELPPDPPSLANGCPDWCRKACVAACPTRALEGNGRIDPRRCISFLTYFGGGLTPLALRAPMGTYVYGCDRCQNVCPRNAGWLARDKPASARVAAKAPDFQLANLLHMDRDYFLARVWPHMFYMADSDLWRWRMNVARAMANTGDPDFVPHLIRAWDEHTDGRVRAMIAWALGQLGGSMARRALERFRGTADALVAEEIDTALGQLP